MKNENWSNDKKRRHQVDGTRGNVNLTAADPIYLLPQYFKTVHQHCNTVYTGTQTRVWTHFTEYSCGHVASVYSKCNRGVYMYFDDTDTCEFIKLSEKPIDG